MSRASRAGWGIAVVLSVLAAEVSAQETLDISFTLNQYTQRGNICFARGGTNHNGTMSGRGNWVHATVVWLEDSSGNYMATLHRWGRSYVYNLEQWAQSSNMAVDGITETTPTSNGDMPAQVFHAFNTGAVDISRLPDGDYRVRLETTFCEIADEYRGAPDPHASLHATFTFTKDRSSDAGVVLGSSAPFSNVTATYVVPGGNVAPKVWAGLDQTLMPSESPAEDSTTLIGTVSDTNGTPSVTWTLVGSEPASAAVPPVLDTPSAATTDVTFTAAGIYTFRLTANDGSLSSSDDVTIFVNTRILPATHDSPIPAGAEAAINHGIIDTHGPWVFAGNCPGSEGYFRFDLSPLLAPMDLARLRLPFGEASFSTSEHHDFYVLQDSHDDWNGAGNTSTDWEATITFNNAPIDGNQVAGLQPTQLLGTWTHSGCIFRHAYTNAADGPDPATECPGWLDVDLDPARLALHSFDDELTILMANRECTSYLQVGSREQAMDPHLLVVEHWQAGVNVAPVADAVATQTLWIDADGDGTAVVTLDGGASTDDIGITSYEWRDAGGAFVGQSSSADGVVVTLDLGIHDLELTVSDGGQLEDTSTVQVVVEDRFHPNRDDANAASITGSASGDSYPLLFASTATPGGDWYAIDLGGGGDLTIDVDVESGDLDARLLDAGLAVLDTGSSPGQIDEQVAASALAPGLYFLEVYAANAPTSAGTYGLTVEVVGLSLTLVLDQASALESAGTINPVGSVSVVNAPGGDLSVTLQADDAAQLDFVVNPITILAGTTSAAFGITLSDNPDVDGDRLVGIVASAPGYNPGAANLQIVDDDGNLPILTWSRAADSRDETNSPLVVVNVVSSVAATLSVPFTVAGTATAGSDFTDFVTTTVELDNETSGSVLITVLDDSDVEGAETLVLNLGATVGAIVGAPDSYTLTIGDDDDGGGGGGGTGGGDGGGSGGSGGTGGDSVPRPLGGCAALPSTLCALLAPLALLARRRRR